LLTARGQVLRPVDQTLWRGVEGDLGAAYAARKGETVVFWGYTSATTDMAALDQFIPPAAPQVADRVLPSRLRASV
jgi:hypothetical protein